ncbi:hypothetical protein SAMN05421786_101238 [Chryseobacterium ureilyticum]|uniref:Uncharacterized protein n=1 Tax=Chryseobacterium ureilyticum TaxID=373668 RepID=A0A1N7K4H7_9FLAO|nr:hypothetical protein [Chryseobacterium ureilyticum]SIS56512.1 hypothetical protein SAMN05421786_101238 [Chryseobacterium ureilyticum]
MRNIIILSLLFSVILSCKGQDKDENKKTQVTTYFAKCEGQYSTGEKLNQKDKIWSLNSDDVDKIMSLATSITEDEWHFSYLITPCNIDVNNYLYKGKKYDLQINGGSYISLFNGKTTILLGCDLPECKKYFLKSKESMEEDTTSLSNNDSNELGQTKSYKVDFNKSDYQDIIIVEKKAEGYNVEAKSNNVIFFNKNFICDYIDIETKTKNNQAFNLILSFIDQYQNIFRKVVIPVFFKNNNLYIEKIFIATLGTSARTGEEEWIKKEVSKKTPLKQLDLNEFLSK